MTDLSEVIRVPNGDLPQLMANLPLALPSLALIRYSIAFELRCSVGFEFLVDRWPDFRLVLLYPHNMDESAFGLELKRTCSLGIVNLPDIQYGSVVSNFLASVQQHVGFHPRVLFAAIDSKIDRIIFDFFTKFIKELRIVNEMVTCFPMRLDAADLVVPDLTTLQDEKYFVNILNVQDANQVNSEWTYGTEITIGLIRMQIEECCTVAVRYKHAEEGKSQLIGYAIQQCDGSYGMLHINAKHRGKGLAKIIICKIANKIFARQEIVFCYVRTDNHVSKNLHRKLGFKVASSDCSWMDFCPKTDHDNGKLNN